MKDQPTSPAESKRISDRLTSVRASRIIHSELVVLHIGCTLSSPVTNRSGTVIMGMA